MSGECVAVPRVGLENVELFFMALRGERLCVCRYRVDRKGNMVEWGKMVLVNVEVLRCTLWGGNKYTLRLSQREGGLCGRESGPTARTGTTSPC